MVILSSMGLVCGLISFLLGRLAVVTGKKSLKDREKLMPFECGFDPFNKARIPFSLRFFLITIIFLIFDVEVAILLPLALIKGSVRRGVRQLLRLLVILILIAGLVHE